MKPEVAPAENMIRLSPHARLRADMDACLTLRYPDLGCKECVRICPTSALSIGVSTLALSDACSDCGRCAARCPTGALSVAVLDGDLPVEASGGVRVECTRVPPGSCDTDAIRVTCTGALSVAQWLTLASAAGDADTTVVDRGWCESCKSGGHPHPATCNIDEANTLLAEIGWPEERRIRIVQAPLPVTLPPSHDTGGARHEEPIDRRGFLRRLAGEAATAGHRLAGQPADPRSLPNGRRRILPSPRLATLARLRNLSCDDAILPSTLSHTVTVSSACHGHQVCARSCPTTALRSIEDAARAGLGFDPALCIGCGLCEKQCPEQAIRVALGAEQYLATTPKVLIAHHRRRCLDCGAFFVPHRDVHEDDACPACAKSQELGRSLFADLFRT